MPSEALAEMAKVRAHIARALQMVVLEINKELRKRSTGTPVDTGHARANWVPSVGQPFEQEVAGTSDAAANTGTAQVLSYKLGDGTLYLTNNVPYIERLNRGHSTQAPSLFVEQCVDRALVTVERKTGVDLGRAGAQSDVGSVGAGNVASAYSPFSEATMTEAQANEAILQQWRTGWELLHPVDVPWTFENSIVDAAEEFARIAIVPSTRRNASVGAKVRKAQTGYVAVQLFTRIGTGTRRISELADDVRSVFENKSLYVSGQDEPVCLYEGESDPPTADGSWQMKIVRLGFRFDHVS